MLFHPCMNGAGKCPSLPTLCRLRKLVCLPHPMALPREVKSSLFSSVSVLLGRGGTSDLQL